jgi:hypothetical protein
MLFTGAGQEVSLRVGEAEPNFTTWLISILKYRPKSNSSTNSETGGKIKSKEIRFRQQ